MFLRNYDYSFFTEEKFFLKKHEIFENWGKAEIWKLNADELVKLPLNLFLQPKFMVRLEKELPKLSELGKIANVM